MYIDDHVKTLTFDRMHCMQIGVVPAFFVVSQKLEFYTNAVSHNTFAKGEIQLLLHTHMCMCGLAIQKHKNKY